MSRRGDFSLMYEIIGLIIFSATALIWFGGVESMVGGLTSSRSLQSFNTLTSAISSVCRGADSVIVTDLDLNTPGSTFIMTQLRIPDELRNDPLTMGFIQPAMRKCVGADCLCLLELNEVDDNWQMCTTSDFDSSNLEFGAALGPPGCPFWYYAPPKMIEMALQGFMDLLDWDAASIVFSYFFDNPDPTQVFSYPAPELWGGCVGADESYLDISSFTRDASLNCDKISVPLIDYYSFNPLADFLSIISFDFTKGFDGFINDFINSYNININDLINSFVNDYYFKTLDNDYHSIIDNFLAGLSNRFNIDYFSDIVSSVIDDEAVIDECSDVAFNNFVKANNLILGTSDDIISSGTPVNSFSFADKDLTMSFDYDLFESDVSPSLIIDSINVSFIASGDYVNVWLGSCVDFVNISSDEPALFSAVFSGDCFSNTLIFEGDCSFYKADSSEASFYLDNIPLDDSLLVNVYFNNVNYGNLVKVITGLATDKIIDKSLTDNSFSCTLNDDSFDCDYFSCSRVGDLLSCGYVDCSVIGDVINCDFNDNQILCNGDGSSYTCSAAPLTVYSLSVINNLRSSDFVIDDYTNTIYNDYYTDYFDSVLDEKIYSYNDDACLMSFDPAINISSSFRGVSDSLIVSVNDSVAAVVGAAVDDLALAGDVRISNVSPVIDSSINLLASADVPVIAASINNCLTANGYDKEVNPELIIQVLLDGFNGFVSDNDKSSLKNRINQLISSYNNIDVPVSGLLDGFVSDSSIAYINNRSETINGYLSVLANNVNDVVRNRVATAWTGKSFDEVDCWPNVKDGSYFTGYNHVNDLLAWRRYTSVSRITPMLMAVEVSAARDVITFGLNQFVFTRYFKKIDESLFAWVDGNQPVIDYELPDVNLDFPTYLGSFYLSSITGNSIKSWFAKTGSKIVLNEAFDKILIQRVLRFVISASVTIGFNLWKNTVITTSVAEQVIYSSGGIRTFDPQKINALSCVRMDELGCDKLDSVWVNESFQCSTNIYVRRLTNPNTWINFLKSKDYCGFANTGNNFCFDNFNTADGISSCRKDLLSACYEVNCRESNSDAERYHVFEYWVGANSDPASIIGNRFGHIDSLRVYKASSNGKPYNNKVMLEVLGGNLTAGRPGSIV